MYILTVEENFSSAHQLRGYKGKCENIHGHNWKVIMSVKGDTLNALGILIDFHDLKNILKRICNDLDHTNLNELDPFTDKNPSSENLARFIAEKAREELRRIDPLVLIDSITICESDTSKCVYIPDTD